MVIFNQSSWSSWLISSKRCTHAHTFISKWESLDKFKEKDDWIYINTFGVSISNYFYLSLGGGTASATCKSNSEVRQKVPSKAIGHKVGIWNSFSLDGSLDASLDPEMMFNWINCLGTIHINSKLGREEPLKPTNISLYIMWVSWFPI